LTLADGRAQEATAERGVAVQVVEATRACFSFRVRGTGFLVPRAETVENLNLDGYQISEVLVGEGDRVTAGQVLVRLTRLPSFGPNPAAASGAADPQAQMPAQTELKARVAGLVLRSNAKIGAVAPPLPLPPPMGPEPLFRIMVGDEVEAEVEVPGIHMAKLHSGQTARVEAEGGHDLSGQVRLVFPEINRKTQLGKVRLTVGKHPSIRIGMFARATIEASHSCGVSIPLSAIHHETEGTSVQIVQDNKIATRRVRLGFRSDTDTEVLEGLKVGELIVAYAGSSLHDGDPVKPTRIERAGQAGAR
jgi:multidrug efflux pump subunit AcrA (membrane-fusion protein)